jgi:hypothetical protein
MGERNSIYPKHWLGFGLRLNFVNEFSFQDPVCWDNHSDPPWNFVRNSGSQRTMGKNPQSNERKKNNNKNALSNQ